MVVPLQTLPGWPVAPDVSGLDFITLLIVPAVAVIIIITVIGKVGHRIHENRGGHDYDEDLATRMGRSRASVDGGSGAKAALPAEQSGEVFVAGEGAEDEAGSGQPADAGAGTVGGARARW